MSNFLVGLLVGLAVGAIVLIIYAVLVSGSKADLEMEIARLRKELRILKGGKDGNNNIKSL